MSVTWSKFTAVLLSLLFTVTASASTRSDSIINAEAADSNFIHTSLVVVDPGEAIWSVAGHCALRMECPSKHLDYVYTFEGDVDGLKVLRAIAEFKEKAGYVAAPTQIFFNQYREEKRGIRQQELNLSPKEKQNLWRCLDEAVADGLLWNMDYWQTNCTSMVTYILEKAITPTKITATKPSPLKGKSWGEIIDNVVSNSPWQNMAIKLIISVNKGKIGQHDDLMTPAMLIDNWQSAYLTDSTGNRRPMMKGAIKQICPPQGTKAEPCWFTPTKALVLIIVIIAATTLLIVRRKRQRKAKAKETNSKRQRDSQHK